MHVPEGFLDVPASVVASLAAVALLAAAIRAKRGRSSLRMWRFASVVTALVFAGQVLNYRIGDGVSGHFIGAALMAITLGPWTATVAMTVVVLTQTLLMGDGDPSSLGANVLLFSGPAVWTAWFVFRLLRARLPNTLAVVVPCGALASLASTVVMALGLAACYAAAGADLAALPRLMLSLLTWNAVIGIGEAAVTAAVVGLSLLTHPDYLRMHSADHPSAHRISTTLMLHAGLGTSALVAAVVSGWASSAPDSVGRATQVAGVVRDRDIPGNAPFEAYSLPWMAPSPLSHAAACVVGTLVCGLAMAVVTRLLGDDGAVVRPDPRV